MKSRSTPVRRRWFGGRRIKVWEINERRQTPTPDTDIILLCGYYPLKKRLMPISLFQSCIWYTKDMKNIDGSINEFQLRKKSREDWRLVLNSHDMNWGSYRRMNGVGKGKPIGVNEYIFFWIHETFQLIYTWQENGCIAFFEKILIYGKFWGCSIRVTHILSKSYT